MATKNNDNEIKEMRSKLRRIILMDSAHLYLMIIWPFLGITVLASSGMKALVTVSPFLALGLFFGIVNMLYHGNRKD